MLRFLLITILLLPVGAVDLNAAPDFSREVLPIFSDKCFKCHGPDGKARKAKLRLDRQENVLRKKDAIIVPGKSAESELIARIFSSDPDEQMPPPDAGKPKPKAKAKAKAKKKA